MKKEFDLEKAMKRIEEINLLLSSGEQSLNDSMTLYKEAVGLLRECDAALDEAKLKVEEIAGEQANAEV